MNDNIFINALTEQSVSILTQMDEDNHRKAYMNSESGRVELEAELPAETVEEVMKVWGTEPTVKHG